MSLIKKTIFASLLGLMLVACPDVIPPGSVNIKLGDAPVGAPTVTLVNAADQTSTAVKNNDAVQLNPGAYFFSSGVTERDGYHFAFVQEPYEIVKDANGVITSVKSNITVESNKQLATNLKYGPIDGKLAVSIPVVQGGTPSVLVSGPNGFTKTIKATETLSGLLPGNYTATATTFAISDFHYQAATQTIAVTAGTMQSSEIKYAVVDAKLNISIVTVQGGTPSVLVSGPNGFTKTVVANEVISGLAAGDYTVAPANYLNDGYNHMAAKQTFKLTVGSQTDASINYVKTDGKIILSVAGITGTPTTKIQVVSTNGYDQTVDIGTVTGLAAGEYNFNLPAGATQVVDGKTYRVTVSPSKATLTVGNKIESQVVFQDINAVTGSLAINLNEPAGTNAAVAVTGLNFSKKVASTTTLSMLEPGTYNLAVTPSTATDADGYKYAVSNQTVTVSKGAVATANIDYLPIDGKLNISGLGTPAGTTPTFKITGPDGKPVAGSPLVSSGTVSGLPAGKYTISADPIDADGFRFAAVNQTIQVNVGTVVSASLNFLATDGKLNINVSGTPAGAVPSIKVVGPDGKVVAGTPLFASAMLPNLAEGNYTITPSPVTTADNFTYAATTAPATTTISKGQSTSTKITYGPTDGKLKLTFAGIPTGTAVNLKITGPNSFAKTVAATNFLELANLAPGTYSVSSDPVVATDKFKYLAANPVEVTVAVGVLTEAAKPLSYAATDGKLNIQISGVAAGAAIVKVIGPSPATTLVGTYKDSSVVSGLVPGKYTITADAVTVTGFKYVAAPLAAPLEVLVGQETPALVTYAAEAKLKITATGLPVNATVTATVNVSTAKPASLTTAIPSQTLSELVAGDVVVSGTDFLNPTTLFKYSAAAAPIKLVAGQTPEAVLAYAPVDGKLNFTITGLPAAIIASITVTGPNGYTKLITKAETISGLVPGAYTITPANINANSSTYKGNIQNIIVVAGAQAESVTTYEAGTWQGVVQFGSNDNDTIYATKRDALGNILVAGETVVTVSGRAQTDIFLNKYKADGTLIFNKTYGTTDTSCVGTCYFDDSFVDMATDTSGNVALAVRAQVFTKNTNGSINYTTSNPDIVTLKYSDVGTLVFAQRFSGWAGAGGARPDDSPSAIAIDKDGNVITVGSTRGAIAASASKGGYDGLVLKYSATGTEIFRKSFGAANNDEVAVVTTDASGNIVFAGSQDCTVTLNTSGQTTGSGGTCKVFVKSLTPVGAPGTIDATDDSPLDDEANEITIDNLGNVIVAGRWNRESVGFGPGEETRKGDVFIDKFSSVGAKLFHVEVNGAGNETIKALSTDLNGNVLIAGTTNSGLVGTANAGGLDSFVAKYSSAGVLQWLKQFGGTADDAVTNFVVDSSGAAVLCGVTNGDVDALAANVSAGGSDAFVTKFDAAGAQTFIKQFGTAQNDSAVGLNLDSSGDIVVVGQTAGDMDGTGPGVARYPFYDLYMMGFDSNGVR